MKIKVTFQPEGRVVQVTPGITIKEAARRGGIIIDTPCGGLGLCGKCKVRIVGHVPEPDAAEKKYIEPEELKEGFRLACLTKVTKNIVVHIPDEVRLHSQKILTSGTMARSHPEPAVEKIYLELNPPSLEDQRSDLRSLLDALKQKAPDISYNVEFLRALPGLLRRDNFKATCVLHGSELIALEPGDTREHIYGLSLDVGTTTVAGSLIDLTTGREAAVASKMNEQVIWGDDVISRINFVIDDPQNLSKLHAKIIEVINSIIKELCHISGIKAHQIYQAVGVGNPTMCHLLFGISPVNIAPLPFIPVFDSKLAVKAGDIGVHINSNADFILLPSVSGFVGADTIGVILSSEIHKKKHLTLAVDIGTNGEVVLGSENRIVACSTAAGPAFEGARIQHGMRASEGAIESVSIENGSIKLGVIGGGHATGICGTGIIDAVSELIRTGVVDNTGRMSKDNYVLYKNKSHVVDITQKDIREVQLAKGAVAAGIEILRKQLGAEYDDIKEVMLAGAFGNYIRKDSAVRIGLIPAQLKDKISFVGNAAFAGAKMALISRKLMREAGEIAAKTEYIELSGRADFQEEFANAMMFE